MMRKRKVLYTATSNIHLKMFHIPYLLLLKAKGYELHVAFEKRAAVDLSFCDFLYEVPFKRFPLHPKNISSLRFLRQIIEANNFDLIHCHTPTVSVLTRIAARKARRRGTKIMFTAHGFHFFKSGPPLNWLLYYPMEMILSCYTDAIITINREDFELAKTKFYSKDVYLINGMGVDKDKYHPVSQLERASLRHQLGISESDFILIMVGELNKNKNQSFVLKALGKRKMEFTRLKILLVGKGPMQGDLEKLVAAYGLNVDFLGWRDDVSVLTKISDVGASSSIREGLGIALIEQMACSVPVIASNNRGHREIIDHGINGFLFDLNNESAFIDALKVLYNESDTRHAVGQAALKKSEIFDLKNSLRSVANIYQELMKGRVDEYN